MAKTPCTDSTDSNLRPIHRQSRRIGRRARHRGGDRQHPGLPHRPTTARGAQRESIRDVGVHRDGVVNESQRPGEICCEADTLATNQRGQGDGGVKRPKSVSSRLQTRSSQTRSARIVERGQRGHSDRQDHAQATETRTQSRTGSRSGLRPARDGAGRYAYQRSPESVTPTATIERNR